MLLNPCQLSAQSFTVAVGKTLMFAEASTLGFKAGEVPGGQLYDDACDLGITVINHRSGAKTHWYKAQEDLVVHDEVQGWIYRPTAETVRKMPQLAGWEVHILND